jgi:hypothetical protein
MSPYSVRSSSNSRFSVLQVWRGCCNHVLQLRSSGLCLWLFNIEWGHQCDWLTVCQGVSFMSFWSRRVAFGTLTGTAYQSWTTVVAMYIPSGPETSGLGSTRLFCPLRGCPIESSPLHRIVHVSLGHCSGVCEQYIQLKINSLVIFATNTLIFSGRRPVVSRDPPGRSLPRCCCRRIFDVAEQKLFTGRIFVGAVKE